MTEMEGGGEDEEEEEEVSETLISNSTPTGLVVPRIFSTYILLFNHMW
jgi:hypothetical protein